MKLFLHSKCLQCSSITYAQRLLTRLKHAHSCPDMCASTNILTSHQCIVIPKQTIINEPCHAYLSERRQPLLLRHWGDVAMATDSQTYGEREEKGSRVEGRGFRGGAEGKRMGTSSGRLALCLSDVSLCFICQSAIRVCLCSVREQFMNFSQSSLCQAPSWLYFIRKRIDSCAGFTSNQNNVQGGP